MPIFFLRVSKGYASPTIRDEARVLDSGRMADRGQTQ
jgi:hypothetical protein